MHHSAQLQPQHSHDASDNRERRIGAILGQNPRGTLPKVTPQSLDRYGRYLTRHLSFPFPARYHEEAGPHRGALRNVSVVALLDPAFTPTLGSVGILCRAVLADGEIVVPLADLEPDEDDRNARLIDDYWYWVWNWS
jgi:hypothetical protein